MHFDTVSPKALALSLEGTRHEPHVAEAVMLRFLAEAGVQVQLGARLTAVILAAPVRMNGTHSREPAGRSAHDAQDTINAIVVKLSNASSTTVHGRQFVDATYEGDLFAQAGVPFRMGREGRKEYGEVNAGVLFQVG